MAMIRNVPSGGYAITPNNGADLPTPVACLNVAVAGTVTVDLMDGGTNVAYYIGAGIQFPLWVKRVYVTGTTATGIVGSF
jgi:hypothetical protein